ncbi:MAG: DNA methyltransferase [Verrucomicrobia bacterium]|nr:DNA methyltransferase [Verrucomicrobiota bacterium]
MQATTAIPRPPRNGSINAVQKEDTPIHGWYRFVLSYPPHLVRQYLSGFKVGPSDLVLDPFCGTGTTLVEAKKLGIPSVGCDAHPFAALASRVKTTWNLSADLLRTTLKNILRRASRVSSTHGLGELSFTALMLQEAPAPQPNGFQLTEEEEKLLPAGFLSQRPLQRLLILRDEIERQTAETPQAIHEFLLLALAHVIANGAGNFAFGPEIYRTKPKPDYDVLGHFARHADLMIGELAAAQARGLAATPAQVLCDDARELTEVPGNIAAVITSPPYPNEKDYTRTTRVESILLRLLTDKASLRGVKESLLRSNTRNVFVNDTDSGEVEEFPSIQSVCRAIERRRVELGKDSGFERLYHKVVSHYFGGMRRHLRALRPKLRPGAKLAYVVGDQLSFLMVPVATSKLLAEVAEAEGYRTIGCELWRERVGTKVRNSPTNEKTVRVREEVLLLEKAEP